MVVQHNLTAMNSNRMLNLTVKSQSEATEKLSSGYKINRAADDAAGLSISEKMRKQIRGLTQASNNAQDGISCVQTAEGALNEVQDMLQRMNELAVKAANGTNSIDDRNYIQNEIDQLISEIARVSETTKFNETYLLKGDKDHIEYIPTYKPTVAGEVKEGAAGATTGVKISFTGVEPQSTEEQTAQNDFITLITTGAGISVSTNADKVPTFTATGYTFKGSDVYKGDVLIGKLSTTGTIVANQAAETVHASTAAADITTSYAKAQYYDVNGNLLPANGLDTYFDVSADGTTLTQASGMIVYDKEGNELTLDATKIAADLQGKQIVGSLALKLHVGADATLSNQIRLDLAALTAEGLGVDKLKVNGATEKNALEAIDTVKAAIQKISTQRSALGAVQNRLDHTINNLDNVVENTTAAESQIRDTDMATEMVTYSNNNILAQAGQAMLAQANQSNQGVLSLLQ